MSEYLVSARKYRPLKFSDVVGQEHITKTLNNAIKNNHIAHAYLFCGPRGVGKTTCARIFATLVNNNTQSDYNVFELDGASNNSVDDIRSLIDQVKVPPQIGKYKIYIIDEVHMLSKAAFNAFLKTLEEPPRHSIFILATTEKEKIIPTILSRCQIFDFNRISNHQISNYLLTITKHEKIQVNENTLQLIAEKADGSLRDALSIFDRIYTLFDKVWDYQEVSNILLSLDVSFSIKLIDYILKKEIPNCLQIINDVVEKGFSTQEIVKALIIHFRNLIAAKNEDTITLIYEKKDMIEKLMKQTQMISHENILLSLNCLNECDQNYERSINQRFLVELCVMQLCSIPEIDIKKKLKIPKMQQNQQNPDDVKLEKKIEIKENNTTTDIASENDPEVKQNPDDVKLEKEFKIEENNTTTDIASENNPDVEQNKIQSDLISITEELESMEDDQQLEIKKEKKDWTEDALLKKWKQFSQQIKDKQKTNLYNIFDRHAPKKNNNEFIVELVSLSEKAEIEEIKVDLLDFLKKELRNDFITMNITLSKDDVKNMLYTKEEKYKHIVETNDKIKLLQEQLKLNII